MSSSSGATQPRGPDKLHLAHVEGLRAVAALTVFVNHAYAQTWSVLSGEFPDGPLSFLSYFLVAGHLAVSVFIVISGFCLALPVVDASDRIRDGALGFFKRRAHRILPPYYGALGLSLLLIATIIGEKTGSLWDVPIQVTWVSIVSHVLLFQDLYATGSINYVFWSIAVEWHLYFLFPLLVLGVRRFGILRTVVAALIAGYALRFGFGDTRLARANPHYLGLFAMGILAAYLVRSKDEAFRRVQASSLFAWVGAAGFAIVLVAATTLGFSEATKRFAFLDLPIGVAAFCALVVASRSKGGALHRFLSLRPLVFIGTFSYSLYLLHAPLLQVMWQYVLHPAGLAKPAMFAVLMTAGLAVVLGASYAFFRVFEAPFLRKQGRLPQATLAPALAGSLGGATDIAARERRGG